MPWANILFQFYCGANLDPYVSDDADFKLKAPKLVKQTKWDRDRKYLTDMEDDLAKHTENS